MKPSEILHAIKIIEADGQKVERPDGRSKYHVFFDVPPSDRINQYFDDAELVVYAQYLGRRDDDLAGDLAGELAASEFDTAPSWQAPHDKLPF